MALFAKKERSSVVLIDIDSSSIGGALVHYATKELPTIYYTVRYEIEAHEHESPEEAMLRTLETTTNMLVTKGAPTLRQSVGSGHIDRIVVSIGSPWQKTSIRMETMTQPKPFAFTRALLAEMTQKDFSIPDGYVKSVETTIATILNGYDMLHPFGKRVTRAQVLILTSLLDKNVAEGIENALRKVYHTHALTLTAFAPAAYMVFKDVFPHEKDFLVLHVSGESTDLAVVKHRLLEDADAVSHGLNELLHASKTLGDAQTKTHLENAEQTWLDNLHNTFALLEKRHTLPHTLFLLSNTEAREYIQGLLNTPTLRNLWLTDEPLRIIPIIPSHFATFLRTRGDAESDVFLSLLALYASKQQGS